MTFAEQTLSFLFNLRLNLTLPEDVNVLHPFHDEQTRSLVAKFYNTYYGDNEQRWMIIGINPGRFLPINVCTYPCSRAKLIILSM